ncbi:MAG: regulator [Magnetococcales bacterium]|nr:regulator [Magnetococcales bacterium]
MAAAGVGPLKPGVRNQGGHPGRPEAAAQAPVVKKSNVKFNHFRVGNRNVKDMLVDDTFVWVGTSGGVIRYDIKTEDYKLFDVRNGSLVANGVFHIGRLGKNKITVGTYGGGLSVYDTEKKSWKAYNIPDGLGDAFIYDVQEMKNGDVWIATWSGANRIKGGNLDDRSKWETFTVESTKGGLPNDWVYGLAEGKNGEVWLATEGGLGRFVNDKWSKWTHDDGLGIGYEMAKKQNDSMQDPGKTSSHHARQKSEQGLANVTTAYNPNYIISMEVDKDGNVWCGTWGAGLSKFDGKKWTNFTMDDGLPSNFIFMLHQDEQNSLWVGTSKGLAQKKATGFNILTTSDGLFSNNVFSMAFANDKSMWVGSFGGVARIFPTKPKEAE